MDNLRDFLKSWPGKVLLLLCLAPMVLVGLDQYFGTPTMSPDTVARVGNKDISLTSLQQEVNATKSELMAKYDASLIDDVALQAQTLDNLINRALIEVQSKALGMKVSDETITRLLRQQSAFLDANGQFSNDLFAQFLQQRGMTKDMLFADFGADLAMRQLMGSVLSTAIYPKNQVDRLIDLQLESRELWVKRLAWQDYADKVNVTDAEISEYYNKHKDELINLENVDLNYILLTEKDIKVATPTPEELQSAYKEYLTSQGITDGRKLAQILITGDKAEQKIIEAQKALEAGRNFADVVKEYSEDSTKDSGGDIGTYNPAVFGQDAQKVDVALSSLTKGQYSQPVQTSFGWHIFMITDTGNLPSLDSMREPVTALALKTKQTAAMREQIAHINNLAVDGLGIADIAKELSLEAKQIKDYTRTNNTTALAQPAVIAAAFDELNIVEQSVSTSIELPNGVVWVQPSNHKSATPMSLEEANGHIKDLLTKEKAVKLALEEATAMAKNITAQDLAEFQSLGVISRANPSINQAEAATLFVHEAQADGVVGWAVATDDGATVMVGKPIIHEAQARMSDNEKVQAAAMMQDVLGQDYLSDYLLYLREVHEVTINETLQQNTEHGM